MKLRRHAKRAVARLGLDVSPYSKSFHARRKVMMDHLGIDLVIDVGANEGQYASSVRRSGYDGRIISFEPLLEPYNKLVNHFAADSGFTGVRSAIGDHEGEVTIHHSGNSVYSSVLPMLDDTVALAGAGAQYVADETVPLTTLDLALAGRTESAQWLKVDVQGLEREVLNGATSTLDRARAVEIELSPRRRCTTGRCSWTSASPCCRATATCWRRSRESRSRRPAVGGCSSKACSSRSSRTTRRR